MNTLRSILVWAVTWVYMTVAGVILFPWCMLRGRLGSAYAAARFGVRVLLWLAGVRLEITGSAVRSASPLGPRCVFMANHQSNLDPPVLLASLSGQISFLAKKELFSVPILGAVLSAGGIVPVDRSNREASHASIAAAARLAHAGRPFLVFPEGTRTRDGSLLPFRKGAFHFVQQAGVPVVPVSISGTGALMPRGQWRIRPGVVRVHVHAAISPGEWERTPEPRETLAALVRSSLSAKL